MALCEENCRGGTEVPVEITSGKEGKAIVLKSAYVAKLWKRRVERKRVEERSGVITVGVIMSGPSREDVHATNRRTLQVGVTLAVSPSYGNII